MIRKTQINLYKSNLNNYLVTHNYVGRAAKQQLKNDQVNYRKRFEFPTDLH